jgi:S1-C subfamily serine protease
MLKIKKSLTITLIVAFILLISGISILLLAKGKESRGYLGVFIQDVSEDLKKELNYQGEGAYVLNIVGGSPAEKAGIEEEDIITSFNGQKVSDAIHLRKLLKKTKSGDKVEVMVFRKGKELKFTVEMGSREEFEDIAINLRAFPELEEYHFGIPEFQKFICKGCCEDKGFMGVELQEMSEQLMEYFEVKGGALVGEVIKDSPAEKAGIKAGDIITEFNNRIVEDPSDLRHYLSKTDPGDKVNLKVNRRGKELSFELELGEYSKDLKCFDIELRGCYDIPKIIRIEMNKVKKDLDEMKLDLKGKIKQKKIKKCVMYSI